MRKSFTTEAINLKNYPLNDNDSIVVMFSKQKGLIRAVAKGAKKPKSKLGARIQMFIANKLMLFEGKNLDTISEAQSLNTFSKIRYDLDKLSYSMYIAEIVNLFCSSEYNKDENSSQIYELLFSVYDLIALCKSKTELLALVLKFQLKLMDILGWGIDFETCSMCQCNLDDDVIFSLQNGGVCCIKCAQKSVDNIKINNKIRLFMLEMKKTKIDEKTKYDDLIDENFINKCFLFMKKYIDNISHKRTKIFDVLDSVSVV